MMGYMVLIMCLSHQRLKEHPKCAALPTSATRRQKGKRDRRPKIAEAKRVKVSFDLISEANGLETSQVIAISTLESGLLEAISGKGLEAFTARIGDV
jgi:hypothetical protein